MLLLIAIAFLAPLHEQRADAARQEKVGSGVAVSASIQIAKAPQEIAIPRRLADPSDITNVVVAKLEQLFGPHVVQFVRWVFSLFLLPFTFDLTSPATVPYSIVHLPFSIECSPC